MMNNREESEDMLQEAFAETFQKLNTFRYESTFGAWIKRIVVNKCINQLKKKQVELEENIHDHREEEEYVGKDVLHGLSMGITFKFGKF